MKYKYVNSVDYTIYKDDWLDFLNQMLEDGWKLNKIGYLRFRFEPCAQKLKYQIDYTPLNEEYLEALKAMEYEYIDSYSHEHVFASEDLHALDIQTDEAVRIQSFLKITPALFNNWFNYFCLILSIRWNLLYKKLHFISWIHLYTI